LLAFYDAAALRGIGGKLRADAGEVRGFAYYTGLIFSIYAEGPGERIGAGGRYDDLLAKFGANRPAVGFGIDIDALASALRAAGKRVVPDSGVVVLGADDSLLGSLRAKGISCVAASDRAEAEAYARSWGFAKVVDVSEASGGPSPAIRVVGPRFLVEPNNDVDAVLGLEVCHVALDELATDGVSNSKVPGSLHFAGDPHRGCALRCCVGRDGFEAEVGTFRKARRLGAADLDLAIDDSTRLAEPVA
jgi:hypothetical protein